jgi:hypothetical protein
MWYNTAMNRTAEQPRLGVIDSVSAGFAVVSRNPWLIALPILLDVGLWLGPKLSIRGLLAPLLSAMSATAAASPEYQQASELSRQLLEQTAERLNLLSLLANGLLGIPSLIAGQGPDLSAFVWGSGPVVDVRGLAEALGLAVLLILAGLLIGGIYVGFIGQKVRGEPAPRFLRRAGRTWLRLVGLSGGLFMAGIAIALPLALLLALLSLFAPGAAAFGASLLLLLGVWVAVWLSLALFFAVPAIILDEVGVSAAIWRSVNIVGRNFWSTIGLILLGFFLNTGFSVIWQRLSATLWGLVVSIIGNAYIGSGLVAATLVFYGDRRRRWLESPATHRA